MSLWRAQVAILALLALAVLIAFEHRRSTMVAECVEAGGVWDGPRSKCRLVPSRIYLERDLKRSEHTPTAPIVTASFGD